MGAAVARCMPPLDEDAILAEESLCSVEETPPTSECLDDDEFLTEADQVLDGH